MIAGRQDERERAADPVDPAAHAGVRALPDPATTGEFLTPRRLHDRNIRSPSWERRRVHAPDTTAVPAQELAFQEGLVANSHNSTRDQCPWAVTAVVALAQGLSLICCRAHRSREGFAW